MTGAAPVVASGDELGGQPCCWLEFRNLSKTYGGVAALSNVDLAIHRGEVHGLVGSNGAGKSTFVRLAAGLDHPDAGTTLLYGKVIDVRDPQAALRLGFAFIHQELNLVPKFSALENMMLGLPKPRRFGLVDWRAARLVVARIAERVGIAFPLDVPVETLSVAEQWLVSIARALMRKASLIAMDEPTASLSDVECAHLFRIIRELSASGTAVLYVSHRLDEILDLCDRITVFRNGKRVLTRERQEITRAEIVRAIVGAEMCARKPPAPELRERCVLLEARDLRRGTRVRGVSLSLRGGEVLGLAGLVGSGRTELARLLFGADRPESGELLLDARPLRLRSPYDAIRHGIVLIPEDRRREGLVLRRTIAFNVNLVALRRLRLLRHLPIVSTRSGDVHAGDISGRLRVKAASVRTEVWQLSGGNQQKVVIGKGLAAKARVFILDEFTRGVDIGARAEIHGIVRELAAGGAGIVVISSEVEELVGLCDRVLVLAEGHLAGELAGAAITRDAIMRLSYGHAECAA